MRCAEVMKSRVAFTRDDETLQAAAQLMRSAGVGFLPVEDANGIVVGTITDRDLAVRAVAVNLPADATPVRQAMTDRVVACLPSDDLTVARDLMAQHAVGRVPVLDQDGHLLGVISRSDVADHLGPGAASPTAGAFRREVRPS